MNSSPQDCTLHLSHSITQILLGIKETISGELFELQNLNEQLQNLNKHESSAAAKQNYVRSAYALIKQSSIYGSEKLT